MRPRRPSGLYTWMKRFIFLFSLLGLVGCFLPLILGISLFEMRHLDWTAWFVIAAFAIPTYVGASRTETAQTAAIVGTLSFGYLTYKVGTGLFDLIMHASIGGVMMGVAIAGGLVSSLLALAATDK